MAHAPSPRTVPSPFAEKGPDLPAATPPKPFMNMRSNRETCWKETAIAKSHVCDLTEQYAKQAAAKLEQLAEYTEMGRSLRPSPSRSSRATAAPFLFSKVKFLNPPSKKKS